MTRQFILRLSTGHFFCGNQNVSKRKEISFLNPTDPPQIHTYTEISGEALQYLINAIWPKRNHVCVIHAR
jgi:hypothetical protein